MRGEDVNPEEGGKLLPWPPSHGLTMLLCKVI